MPSWIFTQDTRPNLFSRFFVKTSGWEVVSANASLINTVIASDTAPNGWSVDDSAIPSTIVYGGHNVFYPITITTPSPLIPLSAGGPYGYGVSIYRALTGHPAEINTPTHTRFTSGFHVLDTQPVAEFLIDGAYYDFQVPEVEGGYRNYDSAPSTAGARNVYDGPANGSHTNVIYSVPGSITSYAWDFRLTLPLTSSPYRTASTATVTLTEEEAAQEITHQITLTITTSFGHTDSEIKTFFNSEQIHFGTLTDKAGALFSAVNEGTGVRVSKFKTGAASRELRALISNAKNPSIYKQADNSIRLAYQGRSDGQTKIVRSTDDGRTFS